VIGVDDVGSGTVESWNGKRCSRKRPARRGAEKKNESFECRKDGKGRLNGVI